jgi:precorrin-2/cobalt-factor-2 C20-methyltransferase
MTVGTLHCVGTGPGDPELLTLKAARVIGAAPVVAYFAKRGGPGQARRIADAHIAPAAALLRLEYPYTTEMRSSDPRYVAALAAFYEASAAAVAGRLDAGEDVVLLCEGDPFFYGSAMYLFDRLAGRYPTEIVPGVTAMAGCWAQARLPIAHGDDVLAVLPGTMDETALVAHLTTSDAAVIMKVGSNLAKIRAALAAVGRAGEAVYVERGTMQGGRVAPLAEAGDAAPYFSLVLVPGRRRPR